MVGFSSKRCSLVHQLRRVCVFCCVVFGCTVFVAEVFANLGSDSIGKQTFRERRSSSGNCSPTVFGSKSLRHPRRAIALRAQSAAREAEDLNNAVGAGGIFASMIVVYSEYTLKTTGCGLPAGPFGSLGAAEGISYLAVVGLVALNFYTKLQPGKRGWTQLLEIASGLALLVALVGVVILYFQMQDYGFIPEAVPVEGGRCSNIG